MDRVFGTFFVLAFFAFGILQIGAGFAGIEHAFGWGWALAAILAAFIFRFTLPMVYGCFVCANEIWEWHWALALLFALPGLLFMIPSLIAGAVETVRGRQ